MVPLRPLADPLPHGGACVYLGAVVQHLDREAALRLFAQLGRALGIPCHEDDMTGYRGFAVWIASLRHPPTPDSVVERFGVHRATAYRWLKRAADQRRSLSE